MRIYVVIIEDRHCDVSVKLFKDRELAIKKAKELAKEYCRYQADYEERKFKGVEISISYSCEGDYVSVVQADIED